MKDNGDAVILARAMTKGSKFANSSNADIDLLKLKEPQ